MPELYSVPPAMSDGGGDWDHQRLTDELIRSYDHRADLNKDALLLYEPQEIQAQYHACRAPNVILIGGTRAGKTLCGCIEDARCVTNQDPNNKYPKKGRLMLLGYGWSHIGRVFYPMLFLPGAFKIIRDLETRQWRAYRPWEPADAAREDEAEDAPPLIHPRHYDPKDISWESKGQDQFVRVKLKTGWEILAFSSESDYRTAQGFRVNRIHIDEDLSNESWIGELTSRKAQDKGVLHWTAVPHSRNEAMLRMVEEAEKDVDSDDPVYASFRLPFLANMHITPAAKKVALREWASEGEDVLRMRSDGEFTYDSVLMYPTFNLGLHGYKRSDLPKREVPKDWTRFAAIDPGSDVMGVLFAAVPPEDDFVLIYDELYIRQCDAVKFSMEMFKKTKGLSFHAFIMDYHGARLRDIGGGTQPIEQYREQFRKLGIKCEVCGSDFIPGSTDKPGRAESVRLALRAQDDTSQPRFRVLLDDSEDGMAPAVPHLVRTLKRYRKKTVVRNGVSIVIDEPETRGDVHMAQVAEYLFAHRGLHYVKPSPAPGAPANWELIKKQHESFLTRSQRQDANQVVHFGPASTNRREYA